MTGTTIDTDGINGNLTDLVVAVLDLGADLAIDDEDGFRVVPRDTSMRAKCAELVEERRRADL